MASLIETHESREFNYGAQGGGITLKFVVLGIADAADVYEYLRAETPAYYQGFVRNDIKAENLGGPNWSADVAYSTTGLGGGDQPTGGTPGGSPTPEKPSAPAETDPLTSGYSFDTTGGTVHITQSLETISSTLRTGLVGPAFDFKQAIGVTKDEVEGTDITVPGLKWSRTVARASVDRPYMRTLRNLTGSTNDALFYGSPAGTVLYLGASGQFTQSEGWTITHNFAENEDQFDLQVGPGLIVAEKAGWDYLWVAYKKELDTGDVAPRPKAAYVERVYERKNFSLIEIGE